MSVPVIGAAMTLDELRVHQNIMREKPRDLELQDFVTAEVLNGDWQTRVATAQSLLKGYEGRVGIHGPFWTLPLDSVDPEVRAVVNKRMHQGLNVCEALSATHMVIHSPFRIWDHYHLDESNGARMALFERVHATMDDVITRAENIGCTLVLENIEDVDPSARVALVKSFDSPAFALSIDTGHALFAHGTQGAAPVDYYVRAAGDLLHHVHLQDADGYADRHWALGEGSLNWPALFAALGRLNSTPRLIVEIKDKSKIPASIAYLQRLGLGQ